MANTPRIPRELETREKETRIDYKPPSVLPDPTPDPDYGFRWIATHVFSQANPSHVSKQIREGWEPVKAEDHPELMLPANANGNVEMGGLMLCRMPKEKINARNEYYQRQAEGWMQSVDNNLMRQSDPRMPIFNERKSTTSFGKGTK
ncbi:hypothetical protein EBT31_16200 [bacterium]|nr:hypothetical protein [bacterium]